MSYSSLEKNEFKDENKDIIVNFVVVINKKGQSVQGCVQGVFNHITVSRRTQSGKYALKWKASQTKKPDFLVNDFTKSPNISCLITSFCQKKLIF